jgi:hypothetical protein
MKSISCLQDALRVLVVRVNARSHPVKYPFINDELAISRYFNLKTVKRAGSRTLKIRSVFKEAAAMAGALEFIFHR